MLKYLSAACALALFSAAPVQADTRDETFLKALGVAGMEIVDAQAAVHDGYLVCDMAETMTKDDIADEVRKANPGLGLQMSNRFVEIAAATYCPDNRLSYA